MKSLFPVLVLSLAALMTIASAALAGDQAEIVALYAKLQHAMKAQASDQVLALLAPNFAYKDRKGNVLNGKQFVEQMKKQQSEVKAIKVMKMKVTKTIITDKTAKVTNDFSWAMEIVDTVGQMGVKGQYHTMASTGVVENDLEKTAQGWRFLTLNTVNGKMTMDGKPMERRDTQPPPPQGSK